MSEGNYTSNFKGQPSLDGIRLRTSVSAFKQREQGVEEVSVQGDNATFTVPEGEDILLNLCKTGYGGDEGNDDLSCWGHGVTLERHLP
eukprot:1144464-Pelagomonas_calceolata.AAC.9